MDALIVGAGGSGFLHALALRSAGVSIAAVYDPCFERAEWLASLTGARAVRDFVDTDVVAICSPPHVHVAQAERLVRHGRLTFVEKPIALSEGELERIGALPGIVPIMQWRTGQSARQLRAALATNAFGPSPVIACELRLWRDAEYFEARKDWGCDAMLSIGIHAVDLVLWAVSRPVISAAGSVGGGRPNLAIATKGHVELAFDDGTTASVRITLDAPGRNEFRLTVRGPHASCRLMAPEADPTAYPIHWRGIEPPLADGAMGSPLLVPFVHEALAGRGPCVADVAGAHSVVLATSITFDKPDIAPITKISPTL